MSRNCRKEDPKGNSKEHPMGKKESALNRLYSQSRAS
jgi:hypothetical protein